VHFGKTIWCLPSFHIVCPLSLIPLAPTEARANAFDRPPFPAPRLLLRSAHCPLPFSSTSPPPLDVPRLYLAPRVGDQHNADHVGRVALPLCVVAARVPAVAPRVPPPCIGRQSLPPSPLLPPAQDGGDARSSLLFHCPPPWWDFAFEERGDATLPLLSPP
jgi:hypothetical protein